MIGFSVGTESQMAELLHQQAARTITQLVQSFSLNYTSELIHKLRNYEITGKLVARIPSEEQLKG